RQGPCAVRALDRAAGDVTAIAEGPATVGTNAGTNDTAGARRIAAAFAAAGADVLELGLPYSDPLADGATLQKASQVALRNGATLEGSLRLIERIAAARPAIPVVPMGYANQFIGGGDGRES